MRRRTLLIVPTACIFGLLCWIGWRFQQRHLHAYENVGDADIQQAVSVAKHIGWETDCSGNTTQTGYRLALMIYPESEVFYYKPKPEHLPIWKGLMRDTSASNYARQCGAFFLLDTDADARRFLEKEMRNKDARRRFNAATMLSFFMKQCWRTEAHKSPPQWSINLAISLLADGSLDRIWIREGIVGGQGPEADSSDILGTPIWDLCSMLGSLKESKAVPALISVLERDPKNPTAAWALGEIGNPTAIPVLLHILKNGSGYDHSEVTALGKLKCKDAVPILTARLGHPKTTFGDLEIGETRIILEALRDIGEKVAIDPIKEFIPLSDNSEKTAVARRVLAQLELPDPVTALLELFRHERNEYEQSAIISDLADNMDERVIKELVAVSRTSESAFLRRCAITELGTQKFPAAVRELALLLKVEFPNTLTAKWGWKGRPPDFDKELHEQIVRGLKSVTKQDFGENADKWLDWLDHDSLPVSK